MTKTTETKKLFNTINYHTFLLLFLTTTFVQGMDEFDLDYSIFLDTSCIPDQSAEVFLVAEEMPRFPGCEHLHNISEKEQCASQLFLEFIYSNLSYPQEAIEHEIEGIVIVQFIVEQQGCLSNIELVRDLGYGTGEEAMRLIQLINENNITWIPGKQADTIVRVRMTMPIRFHIESSATTKIESPFSHILIYPNPSTTECRVQITSDQSIRVNQIIYDAFGRKWREEQMKITRGTNTYPIPASTLNPGRYLWCIFDEEQRMLATEFIAISSL